MRLPRHPRPPDPAFASAIICGFVFVPLAPGFHEAYWEWSISNGRPYVAAWNIPIPGVRVNMNTCDWMLDRRAQERARRLLRSLENRGKCVHVDPRIIEADGMDPGRVKEIAFRLMEIVIDSRPPEPAP